MTSGVAEEVAGGNVGRWSRLDGEAHVAMISIPMLLTRRGWLGWATPYFLSLFVRLASLHALRPRFPSSFWPHHVTVAFSSRDILFSYFSSTSFAASCILFSVPSYRDNFQVPVCKIVLTNCSMVINIDSLLTSFMFNKEDCSKIER